MANKPKRQGALTIGGTDVPAGTTVQLDLAVARLPVGVRLSIPMVVVRGRFEGPRLFVSAAVHGDEVNGVEICRSLLNVDAAKLHGTLIIIPVVNVFGFVDQSRYLPDRRDLNRCFPGSATGSLASRVAHLFVTEIMAHSDYGIDLHTGSNHRTNLPQIRADLDDPEARRLAEAFGAPAFMHAKLRPGSMRAAAAKRGVRCLLYEAGEPLRYDDDAIRVGKRGILRVMAALGMRPRRVAKITPVPVEVGPPKWIRAPASGMLRLTVQAGDMVVKRQQLGVISDTLGRNEVRVRSPCDAMVVGHTLNPSVNRGDGLFSLGSTVPDTTV